MHPTTRNENRQLGSALEMLAKLVTCNQKKMNTEHLLLPALGFSHPALYDFVILI